jgi:hypothetical protein
MALYYRVMLLEKSVPAAKGGNGNDIVKKMKKRSKYKNKLSKSSCKYSDSSVYTPL